jgi:RND family efflux transporter MFP subunit
VVSLVVLGALLAVGIKPRLAQQQKLKAMVASVRDSVALVNVEYPHYASATTGLFLPGNVQAITEATINARTTGYLSQRYVDIGSRVKAGQVLAEVMAPELDQQLTEARAETSKAQAGSEQAQADVTRLEANVAQARAEVARTRSNLEAARADLAHTQATLLGARSALSESSAKLVQARKQLNARKADHDRAHTHLILAEKTWHRWQELARGGAVSGQELDQTEADYEGSQAAVASAQADVESAQADVEAAQDAVHSREGDIAAAQADVNASRQKVSAAQAAVTSAEANVAAVQANVQASRANVRAAQAGTQASEANVNRYVALKGFERIVAPFDGVITARNVDTGALINAGSVGTGSDPTSTVPHSGLFGIARTDVLRIQVQVPQANVSAIHPGELARIQIQELPGRVFTGRVFDTAGALDATSRALLVEVRVNNPNSTLIPGMYAQVQFLDLHAQPILHVPADTLIFDSQGTRVATVTPDQKIRYKAVQVGRDYGKEVEITQGLAGNEPLVVNPTDALTEGAPVRVVAAPK